MMITNAEAKQWPKIWDLSQGCSLFWICFLHFATEAHSSTYHVFNNLSSARKPEITKMNASPPFNTTTQQRGQKILIN